MCWPAVHDMGVNRSECRFPGQTSAAPLCTLWQWRAVKGIPGSEGQWVTKSSGGTLMGRVARNGNCTLAFSSLCVIPKTSETDARCCLGRG